MIWIRADANREIGMGHLMRCLSVADALRSLNTEALFITADEEAAGLLAGRGYEYRILHTPYREPETELPSLLSMLAEDKPSLLLIDSYFVTESYLRQLRSVVKTAYMDDCANLPCPADIVINYNIYADKTDYRDMFSSDEDTRGIKLLLGPSYAPLRPEFAQTTYEIRQPVRHILVTTGGSDQYDLACQFVERAVTDSGLNALHYHVVSGAFNPHLAHLTDIADRHHNVHIHQNVQDMASLMRSCDIAVTAGGSTMYELCAAGVPIVSFSFVENQTRLVQCFFNKKITAFGGDYQKDGNSMFDDLLPALKNLAADVEHRRELSRKGRRLVDGQGATRLASMLLAHASIPPIQKP